VEISLRIEKLNGREAIGVAVGVGTDEDSVDDAEDGGGGANAESEREDGGESECGAFAKFADGVAKVGGHLCLVNRE
jgi:hypothetical protein